MGATRNIHIVPFELTMMRTIHYWLNYMCKVSRVDLLAEDAIKFPLLDYMERNLSISKGQTEQNYNEFLTQGFFNTDKYIDITLEDEETEYFIELKYVKNDTRAKKQLYFNDLVRLSLALRVSKYQKKRRCFFIVCGNTAEFKEQFHGLLSQEDTQGGNAIGKKRGRKPKNPFAEWLQFNLNVKDRYKEIVYDADTKTISFKNFIKDYFSADNKSISSKKRKKINKEENVMYLCSFYTKLIWLADDYVDEQSTGLWEVMLTIE